jgi:hypothetical protein
MLNQKVDWYRRNGTRGNGSGGDKVYTFAEALLRSGTILDEVSHYNSKTNRCYVVLKENFEEDHIYSTTLFDGQTGEMLAYTRINNNLSPEKEGMLDGGIVINHSHVLVSNPTGTFRNGQYVGASSYDEANAFIEQMMADDRQQ